MHAKWMVSTQKGESKPFQTGFQLMSYQLIQVENIPQYMVQDQVFSKILFLQV